MRFNEEDLERFGVSKDEIGKIKQMRSGGSSGGAGYDYEHHYALFRMMELVALMLDGEIAEGDVSIQDLGFVDDVVRHADEAWTYAQLKQSPGETWGAGGGKLSAEFRRQRDLCTEAEVAFTLELVTPHEDRSKHFRSKMPPVLTDCVKVVDFPQAGSVGAILHGDDAKAQLRRMCASPEARTSELEHLLHALHRAWHSIADDRSAPRAAEDVRAHMAADEHVPIRRPGLQVPQNAQQAIHLANAIEGVCIDVVDGVAWYRCGAESGLLGPVDSARFHRVTERILSARPSSAEAFMEVP